MSWPRIPRRPNARGSGPRPGTPRTGALRRLRGGCLLGLAGRLGLGRAQRRGAGGHRGDADALAVVAEMREGHGAVGESEQGVVATQADVLARVDPRSALTHDDGAARDLLATEALHAQALGVAVAAVAGTTPAFFVCHRLFVLRLGRLLGVGWLGLDLSRLRLCLGGLVSHGLGRRTLRWLGGFSLGLGRLGLRRGGCLGGLGLRSRSLDGEHLEQALLGARSLGAAVALLGFVLVDDQLGTPSRRDHAHGHGCPIDCGSAHGRLGALGQQRGIAETHLVSDPGPQPVASEARALGDAVLLATDLDDCFHIFVRANSERAWTSGGASGDSNMGPRRATGGQLFLVTVITAWSATVWAGRLL